MTASASAIPRLSLSIASKQAPVDIMVALLEHIEDHLHPRPLSPQEPPDGLHRDLRGLLLRKTELYAARDEAHDGDDLVGLEYD